MSGAARQITAGHTNETAPAVAPGGSRIAYASEEVDFDLTLITPDGRSRRTMLATARNEFDPAWSPVGDQFAFVTDRSGSIEIWTRSRDGVWERPIVTAKDFGDIADRDTGLAGVLSGWPDARVSTGRGGHLGCVVVADQRRCTDAPDAPPLGRTGRGAMPRPGHRTASGSRMSTMTPARPLLVKTRVGTSERVVILDSGMTFTRPVWSPDGKWIATQTEDGLVRVSAEGGKPDVLSTAPILAVTWRPDSRRLVALSESDTPGHFSMIEIDASSGDVQVLNPDLGSIPIANQPIRGLSFIARTRASSPRSPARDPTSG